MICSDSGTRKRRRLKSAIGQSSQLEMPENFRNAQSTYTSRVTLSGVQDSRSPATWSREQNNEAVLRYRTLLKSALGLVPGIDEWEHASYESCPFEV